MDTHLLHHLSKMHFVKDAAGTAAAIVRKLSSELDRAMHTPEVMEKLAADGTEALTGTPEEFRATITKEIDKWAQLVKTTGLKL